MKIFACLLLLAFISMLAVPVTAAEGGQFTLIWEIDEGASHNIPPQNATFDFSLSEGGSNSSTFNVQKVVESITGVAGAVPAAPVPSPPPAAEAQPSQGGGGVSVPAVNFSVSPDLITASLVKRESKKVKLTIVNRGTRDITISASIFNLSDVAVLSEPSITLKSGESADITLLLFAVDATRAGVHIGKILFVSQGMRREVNVAVSVSERQALFDVRAVVDPEYKEVPAGTVFLGKVTMENIGLRGTHVDVFLNLSVVSTDGNVIFQAIEVLAVATSLTISRDVRIPASAIPGKYLLVAELYYNNITISSFDMFDVTPPLPGPPIPAPVLFYIIVFVGGAVLASFGIHRLRAARKLKRETAEKEEKPQYLYVRVEGWKEPPEEKVRVVEPEEAKLEEEHPPEGEGGQEQPEEGRPEDEQQDEEKDKSKKGNGKWNGSTD